MKVAPREGTQLKTEREADLATQYSSVDAFSGAEGDFVQALSSSLCCPREGGASRSARKRSTKSASPTCRLRRSLSAATMA